MHIYEFAISIQIMQICLLNMRIMKQLHLLQFQILQICLHKLICGGDWLRKKYNLKKKKVADHEDGIMLQK
ncbi:hypothetical protein ACS0TY_010323 [Phlomoides rotata]